MSQEVIMFKALNGEEVIARLVEETDELYTIEKARVLAQQQAFKGGQPVPGQVTIGLVPWFLGGPDETIDVYKSHVFARMSRVPTELQKGYLQQTSGIDLSAAN